MSFFSLYGKEIFSFFIAIFTWMLNNRFKSKAKLSYGYQHGFTFLVHEPLRDTSGEVISNSQLVYTRSIILVNEGRESATNISLVFNYKPMHINFWPVHHVEENIEKDGRYIIRLESLAPGESIQCEILSINREVPSILSIRSKECVAELVNIVMQKSISNIALRCYQLLILLGTGTLTYLIIVILQWLVTKTG
ncbi:hypothetical protein N3873_004358 [Escherichia coli]|uniref:Uncharacterized protein n=1 Tax=Escherichia coli TaxID=562 RepID=A0A6D0DPD9_ECOLX|nr:hypothetical protein [Escherichia coli]MCF0252702.1 hypothetical protein [Shigella flexneri]EAB8243845.1 hypothetical protein [Escherichia coli]EER8355303.1 hypothetical protein [Escherichia coli]EEV5716384.1 hypothetical protein [Escherichia coli]EEW3199847.1 hypothetical protein [Escherichia coli]